MRFLVSTKQTQGNRKNDFCFVPENEPVILPVFECYNEEIDGKCGCRRSMCGIKCHFSTTTVKVANIKKSKKQMIAILTGFYRRCWMADNVVANKIAISTFDTVDRVANNFPLGAVLERRGYDFAQRKIQDLTSSN